MRTLAWSTRALKVSPPIIHLDSDRVILMIFSTDTITQMIREGAVGTDSGDGLATLINDAQSQGASGAQTFYYAARWYNSGEDTPPIGGDLSNGGSTNTYASDIANRLTGWTD